MFHVVESARMTDGPMGTQPSAGPFGAFLFASPEPGWQLYVIATDGQDPDVVEAQDWEHVSVSARRKDTVRTPNWREMCFVKDQFWDDEDVVVQYHPRKSEYVNQHPHVLHLWRHRTGFPTPSPGLVGAR